MSHAVRNRAFLLFFLLCVARSALAESPATDQSLLVLRNGEVFAGRVTWAGDSYYVEAPGRQLTFPKANVLIVARDMADAYQKRRAALRPTDWQGHQELAAWCLKHEMLNEAAHELGAAEETCPGHATTARLRGNLEVLRQRRAAAAANLPAPSPPKSRREDALERLVDTLPDGAVGTFTRSIQPLLVNGCAAAACHGPASTADYRLVRIDTRQAASRYATLRNLDATLKLIDRKQPERSPLLTVPSAPHATAKSAIFASRNSATYEQLAAWIKRTAGEAAEPAPKTTRESPRVGKAKSTVKPNQPKNTTSQPPPSVDPFDPSSFNRP